MRRIILFFGGGGRVVLLLLFLLALIPINILFAADETITLTTYYPSPYGVYNYLEVYHSLTYKPQDSLPSTSSAKNGEVVFINGTNSTTPGQFYYYSGGAWQAQSSSSGGTVIIRSCPWGSDYTAGANSGWGNQCGSNGLTCCTPPACPAGWTDIGTEAELTSVACPGHGLLLGRHQRRQSSGCGRARCSHMCEELGFFII